MTKKIICGIMGIWSCLWATPTFSFLLPATYLLRNNVSTRTNIKRIALSHQIKFIDGFYSSSPFSCRENIYFEDEKNFRIDYLCEEASYTILKTPSARQMIYKKKIEKRDQRPAHFLLSLLLFQHVDPLIHSLNHDHFIHAEELSSNGESDWNIEGTVSLVRLGEIEKSLPEKLEKNVTLLLSAPDGSDKHIWLEKDLFLPQKISNEGREIIFKHYKEISTLQEKHPRLLKYPATIEIQEGGLSRIVIESDFSQFKINPDFDKDLFKPKKIVMHHEKSTSKNALELPEKDKETLEKFIEEYR